MLCCGNCFESKYLKRYIIEKGQIDDCDFCFSDNIKCIEVSNLYGLFVPLFSLYKECEYGIDYFEDDDPHGDSLPYLIEDAWNIFSEKFDFNKSDEFWEELVRNSNGSNGDDVQIDLDSLWIAGHDLDSSLQYLWDDLAEHLKRERRFIINNERIQNVLDILPLSLELTSIQVKINTIYFRARIGPEDAEEKQRPFRNKEMGAPTYWKVKGGRANPPGIPFLYLSNDIVTAISEVRPWGGAYISVGRFRSIKEINLIDLTDRFYIFDPFGIGELQFLIEDYALLRRLSKELSEPINPNRTYIDYVPSQFLTEFIRDKNYDGIMYPSALSPGKNIVLFDEKLVSCKNVELYHINSMKYELSIDKINKKSAKYEV